MCYTGVDVGDTIPANLKRGGERKTERADRQTLECVAKLSHPLPADRKEGGFLLGGDLPGEGLRGVCGADSQATRGIGCEEP